MLNEQVSGALLAIYYKKIKKLNQDIKDDVWEILRRVNLKTYEYYKPLMDIASVKLDDFVEDIFSPTEVDTTIKEQYDHLYEFYIRKFTVDLINEFKEDGPSDNKLKEVNDLCRSIIRSCFSLKKLANWARLVIEGDK